ARLGNLAIVFKMRKHSGTQRLRHTAIGSSRTRSCLAEISLGQPDPEAPGKIGLRSARTGWPQRLHPAIAREGEQAAAAQESLCLLSHSDIPIIRSIPWFVSSPAISGVVMRILCVVGVYVSVDR